MCLSSSKPAPAPVPAQPAPVTAATPEFDTSLSDVETSSQATSRRKMGKSKLKVAPKADPSLSIGGRSAGGSSPSSGVNISK